MRVRGQVRRNDPSRSIAAPFIGVTIDRVSVTDGDADRVAVGLRISGSADETSIMVSCVRNEITGCASGVAVDPWLVGGVADNAPMDDPATCERVAAVRGELWQMLDEDDEAQREYRAAVQATVVQQRRASGDDRRGGQPLLP
jgi:hypothetical protein